MQEIHLIVAITKEISSHDHPERSYVALSLSLFPWLDNTLKVQQRNTRKMHLQRLSALTHSES